MIRLVNSVGIILRNLVLNRLKVISAAVAWMLFVQVTFYFLMNSQGQKLFKFIQAQVRQEFQFSNYAFLNRNLSDLESLGVTKCTRLTSPSSNNIELLNLKYRSNCDSRSRMSRWLIASELDFDGEVTTINGDRYLLEFVAYPGAAAVTSLWALQWIGILAIWSIASYFAYRRRAENQLLEARESASNSIFLLSKQVAHDIRSPLSALTMVTQSIPNLTAERRELIDSAVERINEIANDLLSKSKNVLPESSIEESVDAKKTVNLLESSIPAIVDAIASEKREQYREWPKVQILTNFERGLAASAQVDRAELKRVLSNIINNAVEALPSMIGVVHLGVSVESDMVAITIRDTGRGISPQILARIGEFGLSHGKRDSHSGSGLGLFHAKNTLESFNGRMEVESAIDKGTSVKLLIPRSKSPGWIVDKIVLNRADSIVSLSKDLKMQNILTKKLKDLAFANAQPICFQSEELFSKFVFERVNQLKNVIFFVDCELNLSHKTGLDIVEELGIERQTFLLINRIEDSELQMRTQKLKLKVLHKSMLDSIPISFD